MTKSPRILVIRRDNIGDLVCTTPLIRALREQLPDAWIAVLATRYNRAVLEGNTDIDALFSYTKAKHLKPGESKVGIFWKRLLTIWKLRGKKFDWILLPGGSQRSALRFAKWIGSKRLVLSNQDDAAGHPHEVEQCCRQLVRMGLRYETPATCLTPDQSIVARLQDLIPADWSSHSGPVVTFLLSARKPSQRWPATRFASVARLLHERVNAKILLLWSPGAIDNKLHPGDDEKARDVLEAMPGIPVHHVSTERLEDLIAALTFSDFIICCDGGAMHLGAALGKPMVCLFGDSDPEHWGPWKVVHTVLQKPSREVTDISVEDVVDAFLQLTGRAAFQGA